MKIRVAFILFLVIFPSFAGAQIAGGSSLLGPHIGVSNVARATVLGAKFEEGIAEAGPGVISISAKLDFYSANAGSLGNQTYTLGVLSANYHIRIDDGTFDPFLGIGVGYLWETNNYPDPSGITFYDKNGSGFKFIFSFGVRYFLSQNFALRLEFATTAVYAVGGFDFGF